MLSIWSYLFPSVLIRGRWIITWATGEATTSWHPSMITDAADAAIDCTSATVGWVALRRTL